MQMATMDADFLRKNRPGTHKLTEFAERTNTLADKVNAEMKMITGMHSARIST